MENNFRQFLFQFFPFFKLCVLLSLMFYINFIFGLLLFIILHLTYIFLMKSLFQLVPFTSCDKLFLNNPETEDYIGITFMKITKGKQKEFLEFFLNNAFDKLAKFRAVKKFSFGEYWWKLLSIEEGRKRLKVKYDSETIIKEEKELGEFSTSFLKTHFDIDKDNLPFEVYVFDNPNSIPLVGFKFHHAMSDGVGFVSTFISMSNNYTPDVFPFKLRETTWIEILLLNLKVLILSPLYLFKHFKQNLIDIDCGPSSFKYINHNSIRKDTPKKTDSGSDSESKSLTKGYKSNTNKEISKSPKNGTLFSLSKERNLRDFIEINKHLKISFNDLVLSVITSATNKLYKSKNYSNNTHIGIICPVSMRGFPKSLEECKVENDCFGVSVTLPLIKSPLEEVSKVSSRLKQAYRDISYIKTGDYAAKFVSFFVPDYFSKSLSRIPIQKADLVISNVAGPNKAVYYNDIELYNFYPFATTGRQGTFLTLSSYNNKFHFQFNVNEGIDLDPWEVIEFFEAEFDELLDNYRKLKKISE